MTPRPPALAAQRFAADRAAFAALDLAARFARIRATNLWGAPASRAGLGSESAASAAVAATLTDVLTQLGATSLLDAPCADTRWLPDLPGVAVIGVDIVPAVERARAAGGDFCLADITREPLPRAQAILCRDCLIHLSFAKSPAWSSTFEQAARHGC